MSGRQAGHLPGNEADTLFASPSQRQERGSTREGDSKSQHQRDTMVSSRPDASQFDAEEQREAALRAELQGLQNINHVIEGVVGSLERAKQNMEAGPLVSYAVSCH